MLALPAMDAAQALADLTEVSSQIDGAVLADGDGNVLASTLPDAGKGAGLARGAVAVLETAGQTRATGDGAHLTHLVAATRGGCVFVVRDARRVVAAVTGPDPTVGLVLYDLRTCLRLVEDEAEAGAVEAGGPGHEKADVRGDADA